MEIPVTENGHGVGSSGGVSNVCMNTQDEVSVLPKTLDLPPSYNEAAFSKRKQGSTLIIATTLEASNPNEPNVASTMTTTTITFLVNGQPHPQVM